MNEKRNKFGELSPKEIQEITDNAVPETTKRPKFRMRIFNGTYPLRFPLKVAKFQISANMNIEILCLHEDYLTATILT